MSGLVWPFQKHNLKPDKIFNDLIQFHNDQQNMSLSGAMGILNSLTQEDSLMDVSKMKKDERKTSIDTSNITKASISGPSVGRLS